MKNKNNDKKLITKPDVLQKKWSIPIFKPILPNVSKLKNYISIIDRERWYSNYGHLQREFANRLSKHFDVDERRVCLTSSGTMGLVAALSVLAKKKGRCLMPAWTFVASAQAAVWAGLTPEFLDVDSPNGVLDLAAVSERIQRSPENVAAVLVVSPFGLPIDHEPWLRLSYDTGVPVLLDAAAAFDSLVDSGLPAVISMHATKVLSSAEGGLVIMPTAELAEQTIRATNFGFYGTREAARFGQNGRMSEYHAAVGLAGLDDWEKSRQDFRRVALAYRCCLQGKKDVQFADGYGTDWVSATAVVRVMRRKIKNIEELLTKRSIETRRWWQAGCHRHEAFRANTRSNLTWTEHHSEISLGLPIYRDLTEANIKKICDIIKESL